MKKTGFEVDYEVYKIELGENFGMKYFGGFV